MPFIRPYVPKRGHPIETGSFIVGTRSTHEMYEEILEWIDLSETGGIVYGPPRYGKTFAISYIIGLLQEEFDGTLPTVKFGCKSHTRASELTFYGEWLDAIEHNFKSGKSPEKRKRLIEFLISISSNNAHRKIVLFIDEAQRLQTDHLKWLTDIHNEITEHGINPTFILVGQKELAARRNALAVAKQFQIIGRFMVQAHRFDGIKNAEDINFCLKGYDENSDFPEGSGWSYTRYFFPAAYEQGWRLARFSEVLWKAFMEIKTEYHLPGPKELPMKYLITAVNYVLKRYSDLEETQPLLSLNMMREAVLKSGYHLTGECLDAEGVSDDFI